MDYIEVTIDKPLGDNYVFVRDIYIKQAARERKMLKINIPKGSAIVDPLVWARTGKRIEKVMKIKDHPMVLFGNIVHYEGEKEIVKDTSSQIPLL